MNKKEFINGYNGRKLILYERDSDYDYGNGCAIKQSCHTVSNSANVCFDKKKSIEKKIIRDKKQKGQNEWEKKKKERKIEKCSFIVIFEQLWVVVVVVVHQIPDMVQNEAHAAQI